MLTWRGGLRWQATSIVCSPITRPHGSPQQAPLQVEGLHNTAQPRKGPETPKCPRKASSGPKMGRDMPLEAEPPVHLRCLLWERSPEESGWRGAGVPPPATSSLATQRRRHDGGEHPQHFLIFLSPSYLGSCPPLSPYLLALANLGWWALYKYGYRSSYQSVAGYRYGRYQLSISE